MNTSAAASPAFGAAGLVALFALLLLHRPLGALIRLLARSAVGLGFLALFSQVSHLAGITLEVNWINALVLGLLGPPGFGLLLMLQWALR